MAGLVPAINVLEPLNSEDVESLLSASITA